MKTLNLNALESYNVKPLTPHEMKELSGGFLPIAVVYACWGIMAACSAVALGMKAAMK